MTYEFSNAKKNKMITEGGPTPLAKLRAPRGEEFLFSPLPLLQKGFTRALNKLKQAKVLL